MRHECEDERWPPALAFYAVIQGYKMPEKEVAYYMISNQGEEFKIDHCPFCGVKI